MFDLAAREWSERVLELCGLDADIFPSVVEPGTVMMQLLEGRVDMQRDDLTRLHSGPVGNTTR